jgi:hypothetical protein
METNMSEDFLTDEEALAEFRYLLVEERISAKAVATAEAYYARTGKLSQYVITTLELRSVRVWVRGARYAKPGTT